jgi:hypothetical protein
MTPEEEILAGDAVDRLLAEPAVQGVLAALEARYIDNWKTGTSLEAREAAWASASALDDLQISLLAVVDSGRRAFADKVKEPPAPRTGAL